MWKTRWRRPWIALGSIAGILTLVYLLRWPLLGWIARGELEALARTIFHAEVEVERLGGRLLSSLQADGINLKPGPASWFHSFTVRRLDVAYGLFGTGDLVVTLHGARLALAPPRDPEPPHEVVPKVVLALQGFRFPGRLRAIDSTVVLPDGSEITVVDGELSAGSYRVRLRREPYGETQIQASFDDDGAFNANAQAAAGGVRFFSVEVAPRSERRQALVAQAEFQGRRIVLEGHASLHEDGRFAGIAGKATLSEGAAGLRVDLVSGIARVDFDGTLPVHDPFEADLSIQGSTEGPIAGPIEDWKIGPTRITAAGIRWRGLDVDYGKAEVADGTLRSVSFRAMARRRADRLSVEGTLGAAPFSLDAELKAHFDAASPYLALLQARPPVEAVGVGVAGRLTAGMSGVRFEGRVSAGEGSVLGNPWKLLAAEGSVHGDAIEVRGLTLRGTPFAPEIFAFGSARAAEGVWEIERAQIVAGDDDIQARGVLGADRALVFFDAQGRFSWLAGLGLRAPDAILPIAVSGEILASSHEASLEAWLRMAAGAPSRISATGRRHNRGWRVLVQPTLVETMGRHFQLQAPAEFDIGEGFLELIRFETSVDRPEASASIRGRLEWREAELTAELRAEPRVRGLALPPLTARMSIHEQSSSIDVAWGDHLIVRGSVGDRIDLEAVASLADLEAEWVREILGREPIRGSIEIRCRVAGPRRSPQGSGEIDLRRIAWGRLPALSLTIPFRIQGEEATFPETTHRTPFGPVTLSARIAPGWIQAEAEGRIVDPAPLLNHVAPETRPWIPLTGSLFRIEVGNSRVSLRVAAAQGGMAMPDPVGELRDVSIAAEWMEGRVKIHSVQGRLGGGPFVAEGEWRIFDPGRPLKLSVSGTQLLVGSRRDVRIRASPRIDLMWTEGEGMMIRGEAEVPLLLYFSEFPTGGGNSRASKKLTAPGIRLLPAEGGGSRIPGIPGLEKVFLDLKVKSTGEVRIENSILGALLEVEGRIRGTAAAPSASGAVIARRGQIRLATGVFVNIAKGRIDLPGAPGQEPTVHFEGVVGRGEGQISIIVMGPLASPFLSLQSDPPRKQEELLAMIAFGAGPGEFQSDRAIGAVVRKLFEQFTDDWPSADAERASKRGLALGLVDSGPTRPNVPWELPSTGSAGGPMVRTEYILNDRVSVVAESDLEANWSGEIKLRLRFR